MKSNTDLEKKFFLAIKNGHLKSVDDMVKNDPNLLEAYDYDEFGATCLNLACGHRNNMEMVNKLIDLGVDINRRSDWDPGPWSAATLALNYYDNTMAEHLLNCGAELNIHLACGLSRIERIREILSTSPEKIQEREGDGCTPLHFSGSTEVVDLLIENGASINERCKDHYSTPVQWAARRGKGIAQRLFQHGATPDIFSAVLCGAKDIVTDMIMSNPDILHARANHDYFPPEPTPDFFNILVFHVGLNGTPLHAAAIGNHPDLIHFLVSSGLDVNITGAYDSCTALHLAAFDNNVKAAEALIDSGADIEKRSGEIHQNTPMGWAIVAGSADIAKLLLSKGCQIQDYYLSDAQHGIEGGFQSIKATPKQQYERLFSLLQDSF